MKAFVVILGLICAALAFGYYKRHTGAKVELEKAVEHHAGLSNKVTELNTRLALTTGTNETARSNLVHLLERRTLEVLGLSNRLVQTRLLLKQAQTETYDAQLGLQTKATQLGTAEAQRDDYNRQLEALPALQKELAETQQKVAALTTAREVALLEASRARVDRAEMEAKLENPSFLRVQLTKVEDEAEMKRRYAQGRVPSARDKRVQLELLPDETVRAVQAPPK